jgi:hypothetical protein
MSDLRVRGPGTLFFLYLGPKFVEGTDHAAPANPRPDGCAYFVRDPSMPSARPIVNDRVELRSAPTLAT